MNMTREDAMKAFEEIKEAAWGYHIGGEVLGISYSEFIDIMSAALSALRLVSREQVERMRGEWVAKHRHRGGFRRVTGVDDMGEQRTITIDDRCEYDDRYCSKCGKQSPDNFLNFCGYCGAPMTDEAVEIRLKELEALKDGL